uniref:Transglutaminase-like domain-containing protein n=1 Tax=Monopterus albus TaxID=43700 RepID=A0A3Q3KL79_MONAL
LSDTSRTQTEKPFVVSLSSCNCFTPFVFTFTHFMPLSLFVILCMFVDVFLLSLYVQSVDMCQQVNKPAHHTTAYNVQNLVVRRGQEFVMNITFNLPLTADDDFQVEFLIAFYFLKHGIQILQTQGQMLVLGITPTANAIVGKFRIYVAILSGTGMQRTKRDPTTDLYLLFNAWCPEDAVFLPDEDQRREYVLNDSGVIFQGSVDKVTQRTWAYGQFERSILDACIYILDMSRMPISKRGDIIKVVRQGSAMINSQDDNGVLVGNWSDDFSMGKAPTSWTGSVSILLQYLSTGVPVCFAQCWVYAGVFNTFLRCLGIPARVITNFLSAHDNSGNLKTYMIFESDGSLDRRNTRDSIWNFHCWNEAFMTRADLPPNFGGWQVVDATPQETSDGFYRCGPASVAAVKEGLLCHPFDLRFVFAEVQSEVVCMKRDRYGTLTPFAVYKDYVGKAIYTKAIGSTAPEDITHTYKYPDEQWHGVSLPGLSALPFLCPFLQVTLGQDLNVVVVFTNQGDNPATVNAHLGVSVVFYTGAPASDFSDQDFVVTVAAGSTESVKFRITAVEYMPQLGSQLSIQFTVTGEYSGQLVNAMKVVELQTPALTVKVKYTSPQVGRNMFLTVSFTNPFPFYLEDARLHIEGPGLLYPVEYYYRCCAHTNTPMESFIPRLAGARYLMAVLDCSNLRQVTSTAQHVTVTGPVHLLSLLSLRGEAGSAGSQSDGV